MDASDLLGQNLFLILLFLVNGVGIFLGSFYQKKGALRPLLLFLARMVALGFIIWSLISLTFYFRR
jgi:hypothetical protein